MAVGFLNLVRVTLSTTGTGSTLTINAAVSGWLDFAGAGGVNGTVYRYAIIDGNNSEIGTITYNSGTNTLSGRTVTNSTNGGLALNLTSAAILAVSVAGQDLVPGGTNFGTIASQAASAVAITGGTISGLSSLGVSGVSTLASSVNLTGAEGFQLGWQIAGAGQSWHMNLNAGGLLYITDVTHSTFPFQINPSAPNGLLVLTTGGINVAAPIFCTAAGGQATSAFQAVSAVPSYAWEATGQATDQKWWDAIVSGTSLIFRAVNDANSLASQWMAVNRGSGFTVATVDIAPTGATRFHPGGIESYAASNFTTPASRMQFNACEVTDNPAYGCTLGYMLVGGTTFWGVVQAWNNGIGTELALNPAGAPVTVGGLQIVSPASFTVNGIHGIFSTSAAGGSLYFADSASGGNTWQMGPGTDTGVVSQFGLYNNTTNLFLLNIGNTGTIQFPQYAIGSLGVASSGILIGDQAYVTPQMYGAAGNGTTDDTAALSSAFNSGKTVILNGKFKITSAITVNIGVGQSLTNLCVIGSGQQSSQIIFANAAASVTVNVTYKQSGANTITDNGMVVLRDFVNVVTVAGVGSKATFSYTTGIISSGSFVGMWNIIGRPPAGFGMIGCGNSIVKSYNIGFMTDGVGSCNCALYLQDIRNSIFRDLYIPSGCGTTGYPVVFNTTNQPLGNVPTVVLFDNYNTETGDMGLLALASGAPFYAQTPHITSGSATFTNPNGGTGSLWSLNGTQLAFSGSAPTNFTVGTQYYVVNASGGNTFQLSATPGGAAITAGSTGTFNVNTSPNDFEGIWLSNCTLIGHQTFVAAFYGSDGTGGPVTISGCTFNFAGNATNSQYALLCKGCAVNAHLNQFVLSWTGGGTQTPIRCDRTIPAPANNCYQSPGYNGFVDSEVICANNWAFRNSGTVSWAGSAVTNASNVGGINNNINN